MNTHKINKRLDMKPVSKEMRKASVSFHTMRQTDFNTLKRLDQLKRQPAYVKDGMVYDFLDNMLHVDHTESGDCFIFNGEKGIDKVMNAQALTKALGDAYNKALNTWINGGNEDGEASDENTTTGSESEEDNAKKPKKKKKSAKADDERPEPEEPTFDLVAEVIGFLADGKLKKVKKLLALHEDHDDYKSCKKLYKKAQ